MTHAIPTGERLLVVDDEPDIAALVTFHLIKAGYRVSTAANGADAIAQTRQEHPVLVVLDLMLPGMSGYDVLEQLRADDATRDVAVLMLTARKEEQDRIRGLSLGADDYLTKPFSPQELVLRVGAILRRVAQAPQPSADVLRIGPLQIDRGAHRVAVDAQEAAPDIQTRTVDMHVQRLRTKLGPAGDLIETVRGFGYRLRAAGQSRSA